MDNHLIEGQEGTAWVQVYADEPCGTMVDITVDSPEISWVHTFFMAESNSPEHEFNRLPADIQNRIVERGINTVILPSVEHAIVLAMEIVDYNDECFVAGHNRLQELAQDCHHIIPRIVDRDVTAELELHESLSEIAHINKLLETYVSRANFVTTSFAPSGWRPTVQSNDNN